MQAFRCIGVGFISEEGDRNMNILGKLFGFGCLDGWGHGQLKRDNALIKQWMKDNPNASDEEFKKWRDAEVERTMGK